MKHKPLSLFTIRLKWLHYCNFSVPWRTRLHHVNNCAVCLLSYKCVYAKCSFPMLFTASTIEPQNVREYSNEFLSSNSSSTVYSLILFRVHSRYSQVFWYGMFWSFTIRDMMDFAIWILNRFAMLSVNTCRNRGCRDARPHWEWQYYFKDSKCKCRVAALKEKYYILEFCTTKLWYDYKVHCSGGL